MKKGKKIIILLFIMSVLCLMMSGCINTFDCSGYVKSMLDATYKGQFDDYAEATGSSVEAIEEDYNQFIEHETRIFLRFCGLTEDDILPDDLADELSQTLKNVYSQVRYTVQEADRDGNVEIDVESLNIYNSVYNEFLQFNEEFKTRNNNYEFEDYTDEEFTREYLEPLINILKEHEKHLEYTEPVTVKVTVAPDDDGKYTISNEEVTEIYNAIINYTINSPK